LNTFVSVVLWSYERPDDPRRCLECRRQKRRLAEEVELVPGDDDAQSRQTIPRVDVRSARRVDVHEAEVV
jgi:hypothetical protein